MKKDKKEIEEIKKFFEKDKAMPVTFKGNFVSYNEKENCFEVSYNYTFHKKARYTYKEAKNMWIFNKKKQEIIQGMNKKKIKRGCKKWV